MSDSTSSANIRDYVSNLIPVNRNWAQRMTQIFPQYFPNSANGQAPRLLFIGCSDSRVQESDFTTALPGANFVHRNIANQFRLDDDNALSVVAYSVRALSVRHIAVVGHEHCGGVISAYRARRNLVADSVERHIALCDAHHHVASDDLAGVHDPVSANPNDALTRWLLPLTRRARGMDLPNGPSNSPEERRAVRILCEENVRMQVNNLAQLNAWVSGNAGARPVWVHGLVYDFETGLLRDLNLTRELGG